MSKLPINLLGDTAKLAPGSINESRLCEISSPSQTDSLIHYGPERQFVIQKINIDLDPNYLIPNKLNALPQLKNAIHLKAFYKV